MEVLKLFAPYGPAWLGGVLLTLVAFYFGRQFLEEYKRQNQRKGELDRPKSTRGRSATASGPRWRGASPPRWSAATP